MRSVLPLCLLIQIWDIVPKRKTQCMKFHQTLFPVIYMMVDVLFLGNMDIYVCYALCILLFIIVYSVSFLLLLFLTFDILVSVFFV